MFLLPSTYLPPLPLFARIFAAQGCVAVERMGSYVKQTYQNRTRIASPTGPIVLTVPVRRTGNHTLLRDVEISPHGGWARQHWQALRTAYDSTPFFPFLAPEIYPLYEAPPRFLLDFNERLTHILCAFIGLDYQPVYTTDYVPAAAALSLGYTDVRPLAEPQLLVADADFADSPYWQPFRANQDFMPRLSAIDAVCCLGPELRLMFQTK